MNLYVNINTIFIFLFKWCPDAESNHGHRDFQSLALPTELSGQMAEVTRLELATSCVTGKHSNQLSYTSIKMVVTIGLEPMTPCL